MQRKQLIIAIAAGLGLAGTIAYAANRGVFAPVLGTPATTAAISSTAGSAATAGRFAAHGLDAGNKAKGPPPAPPSVDDVGDVDSFGRNVRWLGHKSAVFGVSADCATWTEGDPAALCQPVTDLNLPNTLTRFTFNDIARFNLPANASNSLLCHWVSPSFQAFFTANTGTNAIVGGVSYVVSATIDNPVLNNPALIDPTTGAPFNGRLVTGSLTSEVFQTALVPQFAMSTTQRKTVTCQGGLISKRALLSGYGLTQAQADDFFSSPMTVRLNVRGTTRFVDSMTFSLGTRIVGD